MNMKKIASYVCIITILFSAVNSANAETATAEESYELAPYELPGFITGDKAVDGSEEIIDLPLDEEGSKLPVEMTVDQAVEYGLDNNPNIGKLDNAIDLALVAVSYAEGNIEDLEDAQEQLDEAESDLFDLGVALDQNQKDLDTAYYYLSLGKSPVKITYTDICKYVDKNMLSMLAYLGISGDDAVLVTGADILKTLEDMLVGVGYSEAEAEYAASEYYDDVHSIIEAQLDESQATLDEYNAAMDEAQETFDYNQDKFESVLDDVADKLDAKINYGSVVQLETDDAVDLMITMADVNLDVTRYAKGIYKNQIAMLIQKNYYDALYAGKMVDLKKVAMERGETQYNLVNLSYENGMKAKDDMLLAKMYYDGTKVEYRLAQATYNNAIYELKKNMNCDMDTEIVLVEPVVQETPVESLEEALKSGMKNRIEMQMALGQWMIYVLNEDILSSSQTYKNEEDSLDEAELLREGAELELEAVKKTVESEICQAYENLEATKYMLEVSSNLVEDAQEVLAIAELKYEQGLGAENSLLQKMNLESSTGTIVELIAAQENLADMEANAAKIKYNNIMAKVKYLNDAGILVYKE
ncbi:Outer membrane protein TolC [Dethiosulfatibacter aminovorans DSM 17477]|uniref:Outer membrane protein TolC n=1 Tax=Dethiosulfatibacter aminovorans DSM 17477 TaxID=1121476 RepID=A0A1M6F5B5_9FIRM|nr:TolC family protein [Dethiosulfatibacter aminovorans]SHI92863.1 Outer membrane protein TolC [Dethiosulfatibacter aminovorans DSM 17477]